MHVKKFSTIKEAEHIPSSFSIPMILALDADRFFMHKKKHNVQKRKRLHEKVLCLKEHAIEITYFEEKKIKPLTKKQRKSNWRDCF